MIIFTVSSKNIGSLKVFCGFALTISGRFINFIRSSGQAKVFDKNNFIPEQKTILLSRNGILLSPFGKKARAGICLGWMA